MALGRGSLTRRFSRSSSQSSSHSHGSVTHFTGTDNNNHTRPIDKDFSPRDRPRPQWVASRNVFVENKINHPTNPIISNSDYESDSDTATESDSDTATESESDSDMSKAESSTNININVIGKNIFSCLSGQSIASEQFILNICCLTYTCVGLNALIFLYKYTFVVFYVLINASCVILTITMNTDIRNRVPISISTLIMWSIVCVMTVFNNLGLF